MRKRSSNIPRVHRKVKKKDMLFEYILIAILAVFFIYLLLYSFNIWSTRKAQVAPVAGAVVALYALVWQLHSAIKASKVLASIDLDIVVDAEMVTISCSISNIGTKSIYPYLTNLYISEGIEKNENGVIKYDFEGITEHQVDRSTGECFDCQVAEYCKKESIDDSSGKISFPPCADDSPFKDKMRFCCNLRQLSYFTLVHIMPKESFRQDVILKITNPGVYRAFAIYTGKEWDDCICTTKLFKINKKES